MVQGIVFTAVNMIERNRNNFESNEVFYSIFRCVMRRDKHE